MPYPDEFDTSPDAATLHALRLSGAGHSVLHAKLGDAIEGIEAELGLPPSPTAGSVLARLAAVEAASGTLRDGWFTDSSTWVRTGSGTSYQFTITGAADRHLDFYTGLKVRWQDSDGLKYGVVFDSSGALVSGQWVTTVNLIPNADFSVATGIQPNAAVSPFDAPKGFPGIFNYVPTFSINGATQPQRGSGGSGADRAASGRWAVVEKKFLTVEFELLWGGGTILQGTGGSTYRIGLPCNTRSIGLNYALGVAHVRSGGTEFPGTVVIGSATANPAYMQIRTINAGWLAMVWAGASSPKAWQSGDWIQGSATFPLPA